MEERTEHIEVIEIKVVALSGSEIGRCMRNAIELAIKEWTNVRLIHNDSEHLVKINDLVNSVIEIDKIGSKK